MKVKKTLLKNIFYSFIVFMYIFMFKVVGPVDSSIVVGAFLVVSVFLNKRARNTFEKLICSKSVFGLVVIFLVMCLWLMLATAVNNAFDFSFFKTWFHALIQVFIGILVYSYIRGKKVEGNIINYIIGAFIIQTVIEWMALISPFIKAIIYSTKDATTITIADQYGGIRGLSLSGSSFFGLAIAFGLAYILFLLPNNTILKNHTILRFFLFLFLVTGTFFAGRTGLIGVVLVVIYGMYRLLFHNVKVKTQIVFEIVIILGIIAIFFVVTVNIFRESNAVFRKLGYLYDYVFEGFISLFNGNGFSTTSTTELFEDMYFSLPLKTLLFGDGYYTDPQTGAYYMNTDAGYMRIILYGGIPALVLMFVFHKKVFDLGGKNNSSILWTIWLFMIITQSKGEVIGISLITLSMSVLFSLQHYQTTQKNRAKVKSIKNKYCLMRETC